MYEYEYRILCEQPRSSLRVLHVLRQMQQRHGPDDFFALSGRPGSVRVHCPPTRPLAHSPTAAPAAHPLAVFRVDAELLMFHARTLQIQALRVPLCHRALEHTTQLACTLQCSAATASDSPTGLFSYGHQ